MQDATHNEAPPADDPWRSPLDDLERTLSEVGRALSALRSSLERGGKQGDTRPALAAQPSDPVDVNTDATPDTTSETAPTKFDTVWNRLKEERRDTGVAQPAEVDVAAPPGFSDRPPPRLASDDKISEEPHEVGKSRLSSFEGVWERLERERKERSDVDISDIAEVRGLGHLPQTYRITVEDRDGTPVDLVPVHRALLTFAPADNISLVNYAGGVPIVSIQVEGELDLERLATVIGKATSKHCEVIPQDKGKLFLRLSSEDESEG